MAFGTLLGAARAGKAIGHDSDSDLLYLSEKTTPAEINLEAYEIKRAFTRRGLVATLKSGSFVTVLFPGPDGAPLGIDVYACFYVDGVLHETATLRAPIPRESILPLTTLPYEGLELPAPADPARLLAASYGPGWQVPDPSFRHEPDDGTVARFEGWFGNMMTARRGWEAWWHDRQELGEASELAERVMADHPEPVSVLEIGAGNGTDAVAAGGAGPPGQRLRLRPPLLPRRPPGDPRGRTCRSGSASCNLYDLRDTMTLGALQLRRPRPPQVVLARFVLGSIHPRGLEAFWRLTDTCPARRAAAPTSSSPTRTTPTATTRSGSTRCASRSTPTTYDVGSSGSAPGSSTPTGRSARPPTAASSGRRGTSSRSGREHDDRARLPPRRQPQVGHDLPAADPAPQPGVAGASRGCWSPGRPTSSWCTPASWSARTRGWTNLPAARRRRVGPDRRAGPRLPRPHRDHQLRAVRRREAQAGGGRDRRARRARGARRGHHPRPGPGGVVGLAGAAQVRPRRPAGGSGSRRRSRGGRGPSGAGAPWTRPRSRAGGAPGCRPSGSTSSRRRGAVPRAASCGTGSRRRARSRTSRSTSTSRPRTSRWASRQRRCCAR